MFTHNGSNVQLADSRMCYQVIAYSQEYKAIAAPETRPTVSLIAPDSDQRFCSIEFTSFDGETFYLNTSLGIDDYDAFMYGEGELDKSEYKIWFDSEIIKFLDLP